MKKRLKNMITSSFGAFIILLDAIYMVKTIFFSANLSPETPLVSVQDIVIWALIGSIGYIFLMAKDSIIEGLSLGLIKTKTDV